MLGEKNKLGKEQEDASVTAWLQLRGRAKLWGWRGASGCAGLCTPLHLENGVELLLFTLQGNEAVCSKYLLNEEAVSQRKGSLSLTAFPEPNRARFSSGHQIAGERAPGRQPARESLQRRAGCGSLAAQQVREEWSSPP